jgi:uncharacterized membrane protein YccF (DUF307 family)
MRTLGNILWNFPFFGFVNATLVYLLGVLLTVAIVTAPIGLGLMEFGKFLYAPFSRAMVRNPAPRENQNKAWRTWSTVVMILYFPIGLIFSLYTLLAIVGLFITIVGIPMALVLAKSLGTYFNPVNKKCVRHGVAEEIDRRAAQAELDQRIESRSPLPAAASVAVSDDSPKTME